MLQMHGTEADAYHYLQTTHEKVRKRCLILIAEWASEFENDPTLGIMEDCYNNLKSKGTFPFLFSFPTTVIDGNRDDKATSSKAPPNLPLQT